MGPSLRVRPHRPTYMRLPKKTTKNLPKRNGEGGGRCLGTPTRPGCEGCLHSAPPTGIIPTHHPPCWDTNTTLSAACRACLSATTIIRARLPTRLLQPNLVIRETLPTQLTKWWGETVRDCGSAPPMSSPIARPSLTAPAPHTHTFVVLCW